MLYWSASVISVEYDRPCSASGMFVSNMYNNVMSFNEIQACMYNSKRVTRSTNLVVNHAYNFTRVCSKIWKNYDRVLYIIQICV